MDNKTFVKKKSKQLGFVWICEYCWKDLIPLGAIEGQPPYWEWEWEEVDYSPLAKFPLFLWERRLTTGRYSHYQVDHKVPLSKGGSCLEENLALVCTECNQNKRDQDLGVFLKEWGYQ